MNGEAALQEEIERIKEFFDRSGKGDKGFYRLFSVPHPNSNYSIKDSRASNFDTNSIDETMVLIEADLRRLGAYADAFFILKNYVGNRDNAPANYVIKNHFYDPTIHKGYRGNAGIYGVSGLQQNNTNSLLLQMLKEHHSSTSELREQMTELKHEYALEKQEERIAALESNQRTPMDSVTDFLKTDIGMQLLGVLMAKATTAKPVPPIQEPPRQVEQPVKETPQQHSDIEKEQAQNQEQQQQIMLLNDTIARMEQIFEGEGIQALSELAIYCQENPEIAKSLRANKKATE